MNSLIRIFVTRCGSCASRPASRLRSIVTLALGIGANAAVFTLFDQVLLRMLPVQKPKELVRFEWNGAFSGSMSSFGGDSKITTTTSLIRCTRTCAIRTRFSAECSQPTKPQVGISWHNQAENEDAEVVSGNYFQLLGLKPAAGPSVYAAGRHRKRMPTCRRCSATTTGAPASARRAISSAKPSSSTATLSRSSALLRRTSTPRSAVIVPAFSFPSAWSTLRCRGERPLDDLKNHQSVWLTLVARLKPGVTRQQADASMRPCGIPCAPMNSRSSNKSASGSARALSSSPHSRSSTTPRASIPIETIFRSRSSF